MTAEALRSELAAYFSSRTDVAFAYLFGSKDQSRTTNESDVDIAVYLTSDDRSSSTPDIEEPDLHFPVEEEIWAATERICSSEVDLVVLNRAEAGVAAGAMLTGTPVYTADENLRTRFFLSVTTLAEERRDFVDDYVTIKERSRSLSETDRSRLVRIVDFMEDELSDAAEFEEMDRERYSTDRTFRRSVERWVENLVNSSIDAAKIVIAGERRPVPHTYRETIELLATVDGFRDKRDVIHRLAANTRVRNMLAHEYLDLRYTQVKRIVDNARETYGVLVSALKSFAT